MNPTIPGSSRSAVAIALALLSVLGAPAAPTPKNWKGGINTVWDIGVTANWLSNGVAATYADGDEVTFEDTATGFTVAGTNLQPGSVLFTNSIHNYTFTASASTIGGPAAVTKTGTGTVTFDGANTFSGGLIILNGTVAIGVALATNYLGTGVIQLGDSSGGNNASLTASVAGQGDYFSNPVMVAAGTAGTLSIAAANANLIFSGSVALDNNLTLNLGNTGKSATFSGTVTEAATGSPLTVNVTNGFGVFSDGVVVGGGGLTVAANSSAGITTIGPGAVSGGGSLTLNANNANGIEVSAASINSGGSLTNSGAGVGKTTLSGSLGGAVMSVVQNSAASALALSGLNSAFTNDVFINAGTLTLSGATSLTAANLVTLSAGGILDLENSVALAGLQDGVGAGVVTNEGATSAMLTLGGLGRYSFGGVIADGAGGGVRATTVAIAGNGTQIFSGINTYSGSTLVSNGALLVNGTLGTNLVTVAGGATLGGTGTIGGAVNLAANGVLSPSLGLGGTNLLTLASGATNALTLNGGDGNLVFAISTNATGPANDQINVAGTLVLNGANSITLSIPGGQAPPGVHTLMTYAATTGTGTLGLNGVYYNAALEVTATNVELIVSNTPAGLLTWQGQDSGMWDLTTANWLASGSPGTYADGSYVLFDDTAQQFMVTNNGVFPASVTVNNNVHDYTFTSSGVGIGGSAGLSKYGGGTVTLEGPNTFTGDTLINGGSVIVGDALALGASSVVVGVANGLGFSVNAAVLGNLSGRGSFALNNGASPVSLLVGSNNGNAVYTGNLTGAGNLIKTGSGALTLTGNNAMTGSMIVSNGTLAVNGPLAAGDLEVDGGVLTGSGTIAGPVSVGPGGTLLPSADWIINGSLNLGAGSTTVMQLGTDATLVRGLTTLNFGGNLVITNTNGASLTAGSSFKLFDATAYSGAFMASNLPTLGAGLSWYLEDLTNYGTIRVVPAWSVDGLFNNNMVLQSGAPAPVWGTAQPGQSVTVTFNGQTKTTTTGADHKWQLQLDPMAVNTNSQNLTIIIAGSITNVYTNVLVGEVWLVSGQSNIALVTMALVTNSAAEIAAANYPMIRLFPVPKIGAIAPVWEMGTTPWQICASNTVSNWSGVAYFFTRDVFQTTNMPIGIIESAMNGTTAEAHTSLEALDALPELKALADEELEQYYADGVSIASTASGLFNAMIYPLIPYGIRGAIWYQGEENSDTVARCYQYRVLLPAMVQDWRSHWQQADFPFYIVQLPNYSETTWPYLREAQLLTLETATNTGLAVTIDVGDDTNLHPTDKQDVGARLAALALNRNYGFTNIVPSGPIFRSYTIESNQIRLCFDYAEGGLMTGQKHGLGPVQELAGVPPDWFEIAGSNQVYYPANAYIDTNNTVVVSSPSVPNPTLARYAWSADPQGTNLYNLAGLPASPFRIPAWTNATPVASIQLNGGGIQSSCEVPTNVTWWVEDNGNVAGAPWLPLVLPQSGTGAVQTVTDPINSSARRFYRWCLLP